MSVIYDTVMGFGRAMIMTAGKITRSQKKLARFMRGQVGLIDRIRRDFATRPKGDVVWVHASSLGEYAVVKPLIDKLKATRECTVVMTFFSPTGYEHLRDNHPGIDRVYYLPFDSKHNVKAFLKAVEPSMAIFSVSEYWLNYLKALGKRRIPTYLISAKINSSTIFCRWYGHVYRKVLPTYTHIFALDDPSVERFNALGCQQVSIEGNPLFENAWQRANQPYRNEIIERFADGKPLFIAGSIHPDEDLEMVAELAHRHPDVKFLFVPHSVTPETLVDIELLMGDRSVRYTRCDSSTNFDGKQVLVIDYIGHLATIYRYGTWAYVGGGFTKYLHSLIEATAHGLPVAFGPMIHRKITPQQLIELRLGAKVSTADELDRWFNSLRSNTKEMERINHDAREYVKANLGATERIIKTIDQK